MFSFIFIHKNEIKKYNTTNKRSKYYTNKSYNSYTTFNINECWYN